LGYGDPARHAVVDDRAQELGGAMEVGNHGEVVLVGSCGGVGKDGRGICRWEWRVGTKVVSAPWRRRRPPAGTTSGGDGCGRACVCEGEERETCEGG
jgi:hypothetical protein